MEARSPAVASRPRRWPLVYFLLATFDVCAILASVFLNHSLVAMHAESMGALQRWTARLDRYAEMEQLAGAVAAPAKDVFDTREPRSETVKLRGARRAFDAAVVDARRELAEAPDAPEAEALEPPLQAVVAAMGTVMSEANMALTYFGIEDPEKAGEHMVGTDRAMANVQAAFTALQRAASDCHAKLFAHQHELADAVARIDIGIAIFVVMMIGAAIVYEVTFEAVDVRLDPLVHEVVELLAPSARDKRLALDAYVDRRLGDTVRADPVRLRQVLMNLIDNAVKFTESGGVSVEVTMVERRAADVRVHVAVRDTGIGIPADRRTAIFESFTQADDSTTRTYGGTGLGLTICSQLVELMGGSLAVESEVGKGSTFWFDIALPLADAQQEPASLAASA